MKKRCTDCRVVKDVTPEHFRPIRRYTMPSFLARCRCCERAAAIARWHRAGLLARNEKLGRQDAVKFREPELDWTPTCYGIPKELLSWSSRAPAPCPSI